MGFDRLDLGVPVRRVGLGLAAVGRPGYITLGRDRDLPADRSVDALRARSHELLDAAYAAGVRYVDVARSYGLAEEFLAGWLGQRRDVVVGSKWGYTYTAGWRVDAPVHEAKDHGVATFDRQLAETLDLLGDRLDLYQIHSVTPQSTALTDRALHRRLAELAGRGVTVGLSTSGPRQAEAIRAALRVEVGGTPLFRTVQATWNPLEPSAGPALAEAHADGRAVIVKESLANGRLADRDAAVIAAALRRPWVSVVLSGAATTAQLAANLRALDARGEEPLPDAEPAEVYWQRRAALAWS
ncbi:aldo/keto reductase [Dactylosporangium aurantiacum]|uniref:Aldo/keto reductase n=1 Tax=Dactylosporangium aurantiacum TaxID=35754 RepID=A0A9Q9IK59_9ACTN|nr:aldo/keto reductase [Dactylosporangium aurantiacum]MDG6103151.1 aldo/keto reductase [Dactylosporangium aurantiacum]UWZ57659.1 aldo/keto reductase [Dactylosporangium aurantiacum]